MGDPALIEHPGNKTKGNVIRQGLLPGMNMWLKTEAMGAAIPENLRHLYFIAGVSGLGRLDCGVGVIQWLCVGEVAEEKQRENRCC